MTWPVAVRIASSGRDYGSATAATGPQTERASAGIGQEEQRGGNRIIPRAGGRIRLIVGRRSALSSIEPQPIFGNDRRYVARAKEYAARRALGDHRPQPSRSGAGTASSNSARIVSRFGRLPRLPDPPSTATIGRRRQCAGVEHSRRTREFETRHVSTANLRATCDHDGHRKAHHGRNGE
jgi:hypothetical protein